MLITVEYVIVWIVYFTFVPTYMHRDDIVALHYSSYVFLSAVWEVKHIMSYFFIGHIVRREVRG